MSRGQSSRGVAPGSKAAAIGHTCATRPYSPLEKLSPGDTVARSCTYKAIGRGAFGRGEALTESLALLTRVFIGRPVVGMPSPMPKTASVTGRFAGAAGRFHDTLTFSFDPSIS